MKKSVVKGCYPDYRCELLKKALEEKKKLGLDESHVSDVRPSSALQALQSYGHEPNDTASSCETEETIYESHKNKIHKSGDPPKQITKMTSPSTKLWLPTSDSFGSNNANDGKPLKSILKKPENSLDKAAAGNKSLPCNSKINTPFFLNNAENEDEFLYGKSVNEQLLRVSTLCAKNKPACQSEMVTVDLNMQNLKACVDLPGIKNKNSKCELNVPEKKSAFTWGSSGNGKTKYGVDSCNSKTSSNLSGYAALVNFSSAKKSKSQSSNNISRDTATDIFAQDLKKDACPPNGKGSRVSSDTANNSRSKNGVVGVNVQSLKVSSGMSSYTALLSFSKTGHTGGGTQPKTKNVSSCGSSQKKDANLKANKSDSNPAACDLLGGQLYGTNVVKSPATSSAVENRSPMINSVSVSKHAPNMLPRSIQKLQMKKTVDHPVDKKDTSDGTVTEKAHESGMLQNSSSDDLLKSKSTTTKIQNCNVKDIKLVSKSAETSLKKDELMLLTYVQNNRNIRRAKRKDQTAKPVLSGSITDSDCKLSGKTCGEESVSLDKETKYSTTAILKTCSLENIKAVADNTSAAATIENSSELKSKSAFDEIPPQSTGRTASEMDKKAAGFLNRKKEFLSKFSSINQKKKKNFYQGKKSFHKELRSRRPLKRQKDLSVHEKMQGQIIFKGSRYSKVKHSDYFNSAKTTQGARNKREEKNCNLNSEINACGRGFSSYRFDSEKEMANLSDHNSKKNFMLSRSDEILSSDSNLTSFSAKSFRKYNNISPERLSASEDIIDKKKGRLGTVSTSRPKRHDSFGKSPERYSHKSSSPSHLLDWNPLRDGVDNGSRRNSMDLSTPRYLSGLSPNRQQHFSRSPSRQSFKELCATYPSDKSCSPHSFSRSPLPYSCDRSPSVQSLRSYSHNNRSLDPVQYDDVSSNASAYDWSPDSHQRKYDSDLYDRSPDRNSYGRSPVPLSRGESPASGDCVKSPRSHYDSCIGSPGPELFGSHEMNPKRHSYHKGHEMHSFEKSHSRHSNEMSPRRLSGDRGPERISADASLRKHSHDRSLKKFSVNKRHGRYSPEMSKRKLPSGQESKKKSFDVNSHRFRKSRIDSYHDSMGRMCYSDHKESKSTKHSPSGRTESVMCDSNSRFSERDVESNHCDSSQNLSLKVPRKLQHFNSEEQFGENCDEPLIEKIPNSFYGISQHQKQHNIRETDLIIPDVNKIVNAIDALASNYNKSLANEKMHSITQGFSSQPFDSMLNIKDPVHTQLNVASDTYTSSYDQSCYNHTTNNSQFTYNSEFPQTSYPLYSVSSVDSCLPNYMPSSFSPHALNTVIPSQAGSSDFHNTTTESTPFGDRRIAAEDNVQGSLNNTHRQCDAGSVLSTSYDVHALAPHGVMHEPHSGINGLPEIFPGEDRPERITTLTTVPLQSNVSSEKVPDEKSRKSQGSASSAATMKFITPAKIEELLRKKSEIRKQIGCLNNEYEKLLKMQGDALRVKRREKDGHKDLLLSEYSKLQDEIKSHLNSLIADIGSIEEELKNGFLGCTSDKENGKEPKKSEEYNEQSESTSDYYEFYDSRSHWCKYCNILCTSISGMLEHVKSDEHLERISAIEKHWYSNPPTKNPITSEQKGEKITKPIKGVQFIMPVDGFYCSLCKEYFQNKTDMQEHLESLAHFKIYQNYTAENPTYECQWLMEKLAGLSFIEIEDRNIVSVEGKPFQKKKIKEEEKVRLREEGERFTQGREEQFRQKKELLQIPEEIVNVKEAVKHNKKKHTGEEEMMKEEKSEHRMDVVEKFGRKKEENQVSKYKEHRKEEKCNEKDEELLMSYRKQYTIKRKKEKVDEASNKIRIIDCAQKAEKSKDELENSDTTDNKQSPSEAKWAVYSKQKKMPLSKSSEPKSKPTQTVVYIGRAPNFKSNNKGNSSFKANLLKLALQKRESGADLNSVTTSSETSSNSVLKSVNSPVVTSSSSGTMQCRLGGSADANRTNATNTCSPLSSRCEVKQQIISFQSSNENVTNSGLQNDRSVCVLSTRESNKMRSVCSNNLYRSLSCASNLQGTTACNTKKSDSCSVKEKCSVTSANAEHAKAPVCIVGPITEEEHDYRVLGINREDTLPLVVPKPPPAALIWPCCKDDTKISDEVICNKAVAVPVTNADTPKSHLANSNTHNVSSTQVSVESYSAGIHQDPITSTTQTVDNSSNLLDSQPSFTFAYGVNAAQQQNVNYSTNVQSKISASFVSVNSTHTSSVQQSYTYPYSSNKYSLTTFQENIPVHNENNMPRFPAAPVQFQSLAPRVKYSCRQQFPPEYYTQKSINFYAGRYPQNQFPSPNVNPHHNLEISSSVENTPISYPIKSQGDISDGIKPRKENSDYEQNKVSPEDVSVTNCGVSNNQASIHSNKNTLSPVIQINSPQSCEATSVNCSFYDTNKLCENTLGGTNVKVDLGAIQQNHPCKLKMDKGTPGLEGEKFH